MAISGIENINIGLQNEAAGSDSLYTAFNKSKNNFTTLFSCASPTTNFIAGNAIAVAYSNSNTYLTITNTGVTSLTAGDSSIVLTQSNGNIIITAPGGGGNGVGGVSNINVVGAASGARITSTGGPIISNGIITLDLATSGANAGTYTYPTVTVDQYGRITSIANASSVGTVSSVGVVTTGTGIQISGSPITSAGNISIINTGVTRLNAGTGISLSSSNGNITVSVAGGGIGVSSVGIASNSLLVTNSPVTSSGTMSVDLPTNTAIVGNLTVGNNLSITGNLTVSGNVVSNANVIGTLTANNLTVSGASSGNSNVSTVTGNLGLRTLASTYTDNVSAAGTIATAAIHAIDVPTLAASNAVTFTNAASFYIAGGPTAGTNATITTGYSLYVNSGNTYFGGANNVIAGNLTVNGNTTYLNVETFVVEDPIISLGGGPNGNALTTNDGKDRGTALQYFTTAPVTAFMGWDNGNSEFTFGSNVSISSEVVTYNTLGNVRGLTWLGNVVGTTANLTTGNMTTGNITTINSGLMQNGTANITIASNGNISIFANANTTAQLVIANSGINVPGYANVVGLITGGNLTITANGNITMSGASSQISGSNLVSANFLVGTGITASGAASGNANITASAGNLGIRALAATYTDTQTTISSGNAAIHAIGTPTITGGTNAKVYSNLSTFYIASQPTLGANASLFASTGQSYALFVAGGNSYFGGLISAAANVTAPIFTSNIVTGTAPFIVTSTTQVANLSVATAGSATTAGTVTTAAQPNITSVGTLTSIAVTGNANINTGTPVAFDTTGSIISGRILGRYANYSGNANYYFADYTASNTLDSSDSLAASRLGTVLNSTIGNSNISMAVGTNYGNKAAGLAFVSGTATDVTKIVTNTPPLYIGNINAVMLGYPTVGPRILVQDYALADDSPNVITYIGTTHVFVGNITLGSSNSLSGGNLVSANYLTGTLTTAAQPNITSVGTLTSLGVNGTVTAVAFTANTGVFTGNGNGLSSLVGANVTGTVASATSATSATTAGTVTTAAQGNITSVGTLTTLTSGNLTGTGFILSNSKTQGVGYASGAGSAGTQATSRSTAVAMAAPCVTGSITLFTTTSTANTWNSFAVSNVVCTVSDIVIINFRSGATATSYIPSILSVGANTFTIQIYNQSAIPSDTPIINFAILRGANA